MIICLIILGESRAKLGTASILFLVTLTLTLTLDIFVIGMV